MFSLYDIFLNTTKNKLY